MTGLLALPLPISAFRRSQASLPSSGPWLSPEARWRHASSLFACWNRTPTREGSFTFSYIMTFCGALFVPNPLGRWYSCIVVGRCSPVKVRGTSRISHTGPLAHLETILTLLMVVRHE